MPSINIHNKGINAHNSSSNIDEISYHSDVNKVDITYQSTSSSPQQPVYNNTNNQELINSSSVTTNNGENGEETDSESSDDVDMITKNGELSFEDKYFPLIMDNIGSLEQFNKTYLKTQQIIGQGMECTVYKGTNIADKQSMAIQQYHIQTKTDLIQWFGKYLIIKQCDFYSTYQAFIGHSVNDLESKQEDFMVLLVQELLDQNVTEIMTEIARKKQDDDDTKKDEMEKHGQISIMDEQEVQNMIYQIVQQLAVLNTNHNHCHLDIKPTNIMRRMHKNERNQYQYTLIDFGFAMECNTAYNGYLGTKEWSAPEMKPIAAANITDENTVHQSTDMWSIGLLIIYCLYNGHHPFCDKKKKRKQKPQKNDSIEHIQKWYNKRIKDKQCFIESWLGQQLITNKISADLFDFLYKCLRFDPSKRLTPDRALQHKWLNRSN